MLRLPVMNDLRIIKRVAAKFAAASPLLKKPGLHEFEVGAGPYGATVEVSIPEDYEKKHAIPSAVMYVDEDMQSQESFEDYEDDLLKAVGKKLGVRVSWSEGAWGRGPDGTKSRHIGIR